MISNEKIESILKKQGLSDYKWINPKKIVVAHWVRIKCIFGCSDYSHNRLDCKDKANSRPGPESFAVDVYQTVRNAGLEINVVSKNPAEMNRIAILLIE